MTTPTQSDLKHSLTSLHHQKRIEGEWVLTDGMRTDRLNPKPLLADMTSRI